MFHIPVKNIKIVRKSIVAKRNIRKYEKFTYDNLTVKRPGNGISPFLIDRLINRKATRSYEADDLIATYTRRAREAGMRVTIVSSDKDLMQLVEDHQVMLLDHFKNREIGADGVREKFGVGPDKVIDVQALAGDSSDNVPGVPGIGVKTAAELINEYGDLDTLLARAEEIKQPKRRESLMIQADMARISRELVTLKNDVPTDRTIDDLRKKSANYQIVGTAASRWGGLFAELAEEVGLAPPCRPTPLDQDGLLALFDSKDTGGDVVLEGDSFDEALRASMIER